MVSIISSHMSDDYDDKDFEDFETILQPKSLTSLQRNQVPEWSAHYLNYKALKKLIKQISQHREEEATGGDLKPVDESELARMC